MGNKKRLEAEEVKVFVAGSVSKEVKRKLSAYATSKRVNMAKMVGSVLQMWYEQMPELVKDPMKLDIHNHGVGVKCSKSCPMWEGK